MQSTKIPNFADFSEPAFAGWQDVSIASIDMIPAPLELQPNDYVQASWQDRPYGRIETVSLQSVNDGKQIAFRLRWASDRPNSGAGEGFADAAALAFPVRGEPILLQMGSEDEPLHFVQWTARGNTVRSAGATGIGSSLPAAPVAEAVKSGWSSGYWTVVFVRDLDGAKGTSRLEAGKQSMIGIAIWNGGNEERAGIKAVSPDWTEFMIEA